VSDTMSSVSRSIDRMDKKTEVNIDDLYNLNVLEEKCKYLPISFFRDEKRSLNVINFGMNHLSLSYFTRKYESNIEEKTSIAAMEAALVILNAMLEEK
jgi:hypothetical protein